jgi:hypothetical protein
MAQNLLATLHCAKRIDRYCNSGRPDGCALGRIVGTAHPQSRRLGCADRTPGFQGFPTLLTISHCAMARLSVTVNLGLTLPPALILTER